MQQPYGHREERQSEGEAGPGAEERGRQVVGRVAAGPYTARARSTRCTAPAATHTTSGAVSSSRRRTVSTGTPTGPDGPAPDAPAAPAPPSRARRTGHRNAPSATAASAEVPYCRYVWTGRPPTTRSSPGTSRVPQRPGWVKASQTTWVAAPSTAETRNQPTRAASSRGPRGRRGRPRTKVWTGPRHLQGTSAVNGSRTSSQPPTSTAVTSTSTVSTPGSEWVTSPKAIPPGTRVSA